QAFFAWILSWTTQAVAGNSVSGVTVPMMIRSSSSAPMPRFSSAIRAARAASSLVGVPGSAMCRCSMPVRVRIHSSEVSTIRSRSAFVMTRSGTYRPSAVMAALGVALFMKDLLKRTARRRSRRAAAVAASEAFRRLAGRVPGEQRPVAQGGAEDAVTVPAPRAREGAHGREGEPAGPSQPRHERDVFHQGQMGDAADARVDLAAREEALIAVGKAEEAQAETHSLLDHAESGARGVHGQAERAAHHLR